MHHHDAIIIPSNCSFSSSSLIGTRLSLRNLNAAFLSTVSKRISTRMAWQECKVGMEVDVPASAAYKFYTDSQSIPRWMSFISSIEALKPLMESMIKQSLEKFSEIVKSS